MSLMTWNSSLSVKVQLFDDQHIKLVAMVNDLYDAMKEGNGNEVLGKILQGLIGYTSSHFSDENRLMVANAYPDAAAHKAEHKRFVKQVLEIQQQYSSGQAVQTLEVLLFLKEWLMKHIQGDDRKYGAFLNSRGVN